MSKEKLKELNDSINTILEWDLPQLERTRLIEIQDRILKRVDYILTNG